MIKLTKIVLQLFRKFGFRFIYLLIPLYRFIYKVLYYVGVFIDNILFYKYKIVIISKPVFLLGHPRSGTTFLHKFILKNSSEFEGMYLWRMIFPTLTSRFLIKPLLPWLNKRFPKNLYDPNIHKTGLLEPETDDATLFFRNFDGMFAWLYFSALNNYDSFNDLESDLVETSKSSKVLINLKTIYKKNLYRSSSEKRIFSKSFSLILNLKEITRVFPDSKIVILIRDPLEVIPSSLSLARNVQMNLNKFDKLPKSEQNDYYRNLYQASIVFYKNLINQIDNESINKRNYILINYKDLINNFSETLNIIIDFCEITKTDMLIEAIKIQSELQPTYKGKHEYTLEEFGITRNEVLTDFNFLYSRFTF
jgi:omega-hydroxy-beta-dihydromenaquinone-9 sulfotransferase